MFLVCKGISLALILYFVLNCSLQSLITSSYNSDMSNLDSCDAASARLGNNYGLLRNNQFYSNFFFSYKLGFPFIFCFWFQIAHVLENNIPSFLFFLPAGLFNVCDKVMISLDILLEFREYFKKGHPIGNVISSKLSVLRMKCREVCVN